MAVALLAASGISSGISEIAITSLNTKSGAITGGRSFLGFANLGQLLLCLTALERLPMFKLRLRKQASMLATLWSIGDRVAYQKE